MVLYVPGSHLAHVAASADKDPLGPKVPAGHTDPLHAVTEMLEEYVPGGHGLHSAAAADVAPAIPKLPGAQTPVQPDAPKVSENVLGEHRVQVAAAADKDPSGP